MLINTCVFVNGFVGNVKKPTVFLTFWDKTGMPDDAKMSQSEEPEDQEDSKNQTIKKEKKQEPANVDQE